MDEVVGMIIKNKVSRQVELNQFLDSIQHYIMAIRQSPYSKADERLHALDEVQKALPVVRRYLIWFKNMELEERK